MIKKKNPRGRFIMFYQDMWQSAAWAACTNAERVIYLFIASRFYGNNNGRIACSVREAAKTVNVSKSTAAAGLKNLVERGFLVPTKLGSFNQKAAKATEYRLTEFPCDDKPATYDFKFWTLTKYPEAKISRSPRLDRTVPRTGPNGPSHRTERRTTHD